MASAAPEIPALARDRAFESLYRRYVKDVYRYALALLRNPADAEDVTQTTFMNAYRAYKRGEAPVKPQNWLIKIAHNAARTRYARASRRVREVPLDEHVESLALPEDDRPDVHAVLEALGNLPLNQRAALVMRELEGRSYAEIAETLGVSVPAVETLIFRARRSLKLKASAVRVLGAVPLPSSLVDLFQDGAAVAGGGAAAVGSGLIAKAAVALVAGAVATGVSGGDGTRSAEAAAPPAPKLAAAAAERDVGVAARPRQLAVKRHVVVVRPAAHRAQRVHAVRHHGRAGHRSYVHVDDPAAAADSVAAAGTGGSSATSATGSTASAAPGPAHQPAPTTAIEQATEAVNDVTATSPVSTPQLPSLPVQLPPTPALPVPPLPPVPTLP
jgi:RNA polymerase sigma factor (sigma-70 family)